MEPARSVIVTVLLLSVDEAPMLERSLPAALAQEPTPEVVVIDNACSDATAELARRHGVRHLALGRRHTYAAAINAAIAQTGGDAVLLLNADCFLHPGFLAAALLRLSEPGVGSVAPKLLRANPAGGQPSRIDAAGMFVDRRRKNGLTGPRAPGGRLRSGGSRVRGRRSGRAVPPGDLARLRAGRGRGARRGHGAVGLRRRSGLARAAAGLAQRV